MLQIVFRSLLQSYNLEDVLQCEAQSTTSTKKGKFGKIECLKTKSGTPCLSKPQKSKICYSLY